jgi:hypothetical protein
MDQIDPVLLDEAALDRLRDLDPDGLHGVLLRVMRAFEGALAAMLVQLENSSGPARVQMLAEVTHKLRSSAASVGALALARCCVEIEQQQRTHPGQDIDEHVRRLITEGKRALQAVRAMLQA